MFKKIFSKSNDKKKETPLGLKAIIALQDGNYNVALPLLNEYIKMIEGLNIPLTSDDAVFYYNRSIVKDNLNDVDGAIVDLKKCIKICDLHQAYFALFQLLFYKKNEKQEALNFLIKAHEAGSDKAEPILRINTNYFN